MNYVPPYMNYNQKQGNYDGNLENPFKENYYQENMGCPFNENTGCGDYKCCNQVEESCQFVDISHYVNYHTHNIMNVYKRHFTIPTCSQSSEVRVYDVEVPYQVGFNEPGFNNFFVPFR